MLKANNIIFQNLLHLSNLQILKRQQIKAYFVMWRDLELKCSWIWKQPNISTCIKAISGQEGAETSSKYYLRVDMPVNSFNMKNNHRGSFQANVFLFFDHILTSHMSVWRWLLYIIMSLGIRLSIYIGGSVEILEIQLLIAKITNLGNLKIRDFRKCLSTWLRTKAMSNVDSTFWFFIFKLTYLCIEETTETIGNFYVFFNLKLPIALKVPSKKEVAVSCNRD